MIWDCKGILDQKKTSRRLNGIVAVAMNYPEKNRAPEYAFSKKQKID